MLILRDKTFKHGYINKYDLYDKNNVLLKSAYVNRCTNPNIYMNPGYYLGFDSLAKDKDLYKKRFKTSKAAAIAFFKSEYKFFDLL